MFRGPWGPEKREDGALMHEKYMLLVFQMSWTTALSTDIQRSYISDKWHISWMGFSWIGLRL
eukprot:7737321-Pyramimonas_sp.AAC.1